MPGLVFGFYLVALLRTGRKTTRCGAFSSPSSSPHIDLTQLTHGQTTATRANRVTMSAHAPPSPSTNPAAKRPRQSSPDRQSPDPTSAATATQSDSVSPTDRQASGANGTGVAAAAGTNPGGSGGGGGGKASQSSNFRNVSACNRCRLRKNRCDQRLPTCVSCEKAGVACVGYDPITKREIPRR